MGGEGKVGLGGEELGDYERGRLRLHFGHVDGAVHGSHGLTGALHAREGGNRYLEKMRGGAWALS